MLYQKSIFILLGIMYMGINDVLSSIIKRKVHISEEIDEGTVIIDISEVLGHSDKSRTNREYKLISQELATNVQAIDTQQWFIIDEISGNVETNRRIDRDDLCRKSGTCLIKAQIVVLPYEIFQAVELEIVIEDINDNKPIFPNEVVIMNLTEKWNLNEIINIDVYQATDNDIGKNAALQYKLFPNRFFRIKYFFDKSNSTHLELYLLRKLDFEQTPRIELIIEAIDGGKNATKGRMILIINVLDANDNDPIFEKEKYSVIIKENQPPGTLVTVVHANDSDSDLFGDVRYFISKRNSFASLNAVRIDSISGKITLKKRLDREISEQLKIRVTARDMDPVKPRSGETWVHIKVLDVNDNEPKIKVDFVSQHDGDTVYVLESIPIHSYLAKVKFSDSDAGENGMVHGYITSSSVVGRQKFENVDQRFGISKDGFVETLHSLDKEICDHYEVMLHACDGGSPKSCSTRTISVVILDVNECIPRIEKPIIHINMKEDTYIGTTVTQVVAEDCDSVNGRGLMLNKSGHVVPSRNGEVSYSIIDDGGGSPFIVGSKSGIVRLLKPLDREKKTTWNLRISVKDGGYPPLHEVSHINIDVEDINDNVPIFVNPRKNHSTIYYNLLENGEIISIQANDRDAGLNGKVTYHLKASYRVYDNLNPNNKLLPRHAFNSPIFILNPSTGSLRMNFSHQNPVDLIGIHELQIQAKDVGNPPMSSTLFLQIAVSNKSPVKEDLTTKTQPKEIKLFALILSITCGMLFTVLIVFIVIFKCRLIEQSTEPENKHQGNVTLPKFYNEQSVHSERNDAVHGYSVHGSKYMEFPRNENITSNGDYSERNQRVGMIEKQTSCDSQDQNFLLSTPRRIDLAISPHSDADSGRGDSDIDAAVCNVFDSSGKEFRDNRRHPKHHPRPSLLNIQHRAIISEDNMGTSTMERKSICDDIDTRESSQSSECNRDPLVDSLPNSAKCMRIGSRFSNCGSEDGFKAGCTFSKYTRSNSMDLAMRHSQNKSAFVELPDDDEIMQSDKEESESGTELQI
uniref:protocadherin alpha-5-like isoform X1 n=1 Tax=Styela clava TaxID=7725 RepID=UPI001939C185|nr:protocadherin alpha-5-like isoform X1 [Styela clava]